MLLQLVLLVRVVVQEVVQALRLVGQILTLMEHQEIMVQSEPQVRKVAHVLMVEPFTVEVEAAVTPTVEVAVAEPLVL
jgi:hypothetical protein